MIDAMTSGMQNPAVSAMPSTAGDTEDANTFDAMSTSEEKDPTSVATASEHAALDVTEMLPEVGHIAAATNAALYAKEGHDGEAGLSALEAVLPGADQMGGAASMLRMGLHFGSAGVGMTHAEFNKQRGVGS